MKTIKVKFLNKEYTIPSDVVTYVDLVEFTNDTRDNLKNIFRRKIKPIEALENDKFMIEDINNEASKFISRLLDNEIYDKTVNDYLNDNKGINLFVETKEKALRHIISIRQEKLDIYKSGVEDAIYKKEASVTGLDFGILTSSFTNAMIYAYMDAAEETKQEKEALKIYNQEINELEKSLKVYDEQERQFILNNFIPAVNTIFTYVSYEFLDSFVGDLIRTGKFDQDALKYVDLERSNDLLKNLELSNNKQAILEQAFIACPFNIAVYMNAMKYEYLDNESFETAGYFKQSDAIIEFLKGNLGEAEYPTYHKGDDYSAVLLSKYTGESVEEIIIKHTSSYANAIVNEYRKLASLIAMPEQCERLVRSWPEEKILAGNNSSKQISKALVSKIVADNTWNSLTTECGHSDLLARIVCLIPDLEGCSSKKDFDDKLSERLYVALETARGKQSDIIVENRKRQEIQRKKEEEEKRKKHIKIAVICCAIIAIIILLISIPSIIENGKENKLDRAVETQIEKITTEFEQKIEKQIEDDIVIDYDYSETNSWDDESWYEWDMIIRMNMLEDYRNSSSSDDNTLDTIMDNCSIITEEFNAISDDLDFNIKVGNTQIKADYGWGAIRFSDISSSEVFYYDEYSFERHLYSTDTEYVLEDIEKTLDNEDVNLLNEKTENNIARITSLLGRETDKNGNIDLSGKEYKFITNDVELFGAAGYVEGGTTDIGASMNRIDIIDWTSNEEISNFNGLIDALKELYGEKYVVKEYYDNSDSAYMWKDIDVYSYVICWENSNDTVTIRWMVDLEQ